MTCKLVVSKIANVNFINYEQACSLMYVFEIQVPLDKTAQNISLYRKLISECPDIVAMTIELKCNLSEILFCFDHSHTFVCFHHDLQFSSHTVEFTLSENVDITTISDLDFVDKIKVAAQLCMADENGLLKLPWSFLCKEQLLSAASMFDIRLTTTQIQNCNNMANMLGANIRKSVHFKNQYGKAIMFSSVSFDFSLDNMLNCIGHGRNACTSQSIACESIGEFRWHAPRQGQQKKTSSKKYDTSTSSKIPSSSQFKEPGKSNLQDILSVHVNVALTLGSASLEQLKGIINFYELKLEINRRQAKTFIIDVIRESPSFLTHLTTSLLSTDVIYCFNDSNDVICTLQELLSLYTTVSLPKHAISPYATTFVADFDSTEKAKILMQMALAVSNRKSFSLPWCALTLSQKFAVADDFLDIIPKISDKNTIDLEITLWTHIKKSKEFRKNYGTFTSFSFIGTNRSPLDLFIQPDDPSISQSDLNHMVLNTFFKQPIKQPIKHLVLNTKSEISISGVTKENIASSEPDHSYTDGVCDITTKNPDAVMQEAEMDNIEKAMNSVNVNEKLTVDNVSVDNVSKDPKEYDVADEAHPYKAKPEVKPSEAKPGETQLDEVKPDEVGPGKGEQEMETGGDNAKYGEKPLNEVIPNEAETFEIEIDAGEPDQEKLDKELPDEGEPEEDELDTVEPDGTEPEDEPNEAEPGNMELCKGKSDKPLQNENSNFDIVVDKNFNLQTASKNHSPRMIDPNTNNCKVCRNSCTEETLTCCFCTLQVHYTCYHSEKLDNNLYQPMPKSTFEIVSATKNIFWLCKDCDVNLNLECILNLASCRVKEQVSCALSSLAKDTDDFEELIESLPSITPAAEYKITSYKKHSSEITQSNSCEFDDRAAIKTDLSKSGIAVPIKVVKIQENTSHSQKSNKKGKKKKKDKLTKEIENRQLSSEDEGKPKELNSDQSQNIQLDGRNKELEIAKDKSHNVTNTIDIQGFTIQWHSKKNIDAYIYNDICRMCDHKCHAETIGSCYICGIQAHLPCMVKSSSCNTNNAGFVTNHTKNFKFFCDSCSDLTFPRATHEIGSRLVEMASEKLEEEIQRKNKIDVGKQRNTEHFPSFQSSLCTNVKKAITSELLNFKDEILQTLSKGLEIPNREGSGDMMPNTNGVWGDKSPHQKDQQNVQVYNQKEGSSIKIPQTVDNTTNVSQNNRVNPDLSLVIRNVKARKYKNSANCRSEFNKHFIRMRIKSIFATQAGNIIIELYEREDVLTVVKNWKPNFFCVEDISDTEGTKISHMISSGKPREIILKGVHKAWEEDDIKAELQSDHNRFIEPSIRRFITREGNVLGTVKINFKTNDEFQKAIKKGIFLFNEHFNAEVFIHKPRAHQCYNCKQFGHPAKWCAKKEMCEYCASEGHTGKDCIIKGEIHDYVCANCKGHHSATYHKCPIYIKNLRRPSTTYATNND